MKGFTLIEILVSTAILTILAGGFLGIQYIFSQNQVSAWKSYTNIEESNNLLSKFVKEIRNAQQSEIGGYPLVTANDQEIVFFSDYNYDGVVEKIRYKLEGTNLIKGITTPTGEPLSYNPAQESLKTLSTNVRNQTDPLFYYYNEDWPQDVVNNPLPSENRIADTRIIKVIIHINEVPNDEENNFVLESSSTIRVLKLDQ